MRDPDRGGRRSIHDRRAVRDARAAARGRGRGGAGARERAARGRAAGAAGGAAGVARADRRGGRRGAPAPRPRPARRRAAAARLADDRAPARARALGGDPEAARELVDSAFANAQRGGRGAARARRRASTPPCSPSAGSTPRSSRWRRRAPVPVELRSALDGAAARRGRDRGLLRRRRGADERRQVRRRDARARRRRGARTARASSTSATTASAARTRPAAAACAASRTAWARSTARSRSRARAGGGTLVARADPAQARRKRQHGEDAAVVLGAAADAELGEDARDVLLDGVRGDDERLGDAAVRAALGHQLEHLALARRERLERVVAAAAAEHPRDDGRVEHRPAGGHAPDGVGEVREVGHAVLEQVADALGAVADQVDARSAPRRTARARARRRPAGARGSRSRRAVRRRCCRAASGRRRSRRRACARATLRSRSGASAASATTSKPASPSRRTMPCAQQRLVLADDDPHIAILPQRGPGRCSVAHAHRRRRGRAQRDPRRHEARGERERGRPASSAAAPATGDDERDPAHAAAARP